MQCPGCEKELKDSEIVRVDVSTLPDDYALDVEIARGYVEFIACNTCGCSDVIEMEES